MFSLKKPSRPYVFKSLLSFSSSRKQLLTDCQNLVFKISLLGKLIIIQASACRIIYNIFCFILFLLDRQNHCDRLNDQPTFTRPTVNDKPTFTRPTVNDKPTFKREKGTGNETLILLGWPYMIVKSGNLCKTKVITC